MTDNNNTNITAPAFERPRNPFALKDFIGFTLSTEGYTESAQFAEEDWYTQKHVDVLLEQLRTHDQKATQALTFRDYYRDSRDKYYEQMSLMARVINEYLEENCDNEDIVASFETLFDKDCGVSDPRRKQYEMKVEVTVKRTYRVTVECPSYKYDDLVDHLGDVFDSDDTSFSKYDIENEWCIVHDVHEHDVDVDSVEVEEL